MVFPLPPGRRWRRIAPIVGIVALALVAAMATARLFAPPEIRLARDLERWMHAASLDGAVVAIGPPGQPPTVFSLGTDAAGSPLSPRARLRLASLTKPLIASAILDAVARGEIALDDRAVTHIPSLAEVAARAPRLGAITIDDLLRHHGGWDRAMDGDPWFAPSPFQAKTDRDCLAVSQSNLPLIRHEPGSTYRYSNISYCLLGEVLARVAGQETLLQALHTRLPATATIGFEPPPPALVQRVDPAFTARFPVMQPLAIGAAGGLVGRAEAVWRAFAAIPTGRHLAPPLPADRAAASFYGYGFRVWPGRGEEITLTHYGALPGVYALVVIRPGELVAVIQTIGRPPNDVAAMGQLMRIVDRAYGL